MFLLVHHFADDTNILYVSSSLKDINKKISHLLSNLVQWLRANKISLNVSKTAIVIFKSHSKQITKRLNFRLSGQVSSSLLKTIYFALFESHAMQHKYGVKEAIIS